MVPKGFGGGDFGLGSGGGLRSQEDDKFFFLFFFNYLYENANLFFHPLKISQNLL